MFPEISVPANTRMKHTYNNRKLQMHRTVYLKFRVSPFLPTVCTHTHKAM